MIYVMSDIHGCYKEFMEMLSMIEFTDQDELYIIGDVIDRGKEPIKALQYIMKQKNMHMIMGNHEKMMIETLENVHCARQLWYYNGGEITEVQFRELELKDKLEIRRFLKALPYAETAAVGGKEYVMVHGGPCQNFKNVIDTHAKNDDLLWERFDDLDEATSAFYPGKTIIVGHTPTIHYGFDHIIERKDKILIDCGCVFGYYLACLCLNNGKEYYVSIQREEEYDELLE